MIKRGFTLLEMLTTVAALVIVLGLMVSLARYVRTRSAEMLTREVLSRLATLHAQADYEESRAQLAAVPPLIMAGVDLHQAALDNSKAVAAIWDQATNGEALERLPVSVYDGQALRDAWGTPIVFMPAGAVNVGIDPQNRDFYFSAGPDRDFGTVMDNLYSYEQMLDR